MFKLLKTDIEKLNAELRDDFKSEISYAMKQLDKGNDITIQLLNIGSLIKNIGLPLFVNLISSGIFESIKPLLGLT